MRLTHRTHTDRATRFRRGRMIALALAPALLLSLSDHPERWSGVAAAAAQPCGGGDRVAAREIDRLVWWHFTQSSWNAPWGVPPAGKWRTDDDC